MNILLGVLIGLLIISPSIYNRIRENIKEKERIKREKLKREQEEFYNKYREQSYSRQSYDPYEKYYGISKEELDKIINDLLKKTYSRYSSFDRDTNDLRVRQGKKATIPKQVICITPSKFTRNALNRDHKKRVAFTWDDLEWTVYPAVNEPVSDSIAVFTPTT